MALEDYEGSRDRGQQVELYQFVYGEEDQEYLYTDGEESVTFDGRTYVPLPISRDKITSKGDLSGREIKVTVPAGSPIADLFRIFPPGRVVSVIIRQGHLANFDDPAEFADGENFAVIWTGRILESSRNGYEATLTCEALSAGMRRPGLRRHYQWSCPLALYGPQCKALKVAIPAVVQNLVGNKITLLEDWIPVPVLPEDAEEGEVAPAPPTTNKFIGGMLDWQGEAGTEARGILRVEGASVIVISGPAIGLSIGDSVNVYLGCSHTVEDCENLHQNILNYGGHPWIPTTGNPVGKNNHS